MRLFEILSTDYLPKQYQQFLAKYKNVDTSNMYVNFTNAIDNATAKTVNANPQGTSDQTPWGIHKDFVGAYAYPLSLVLRPEYSKIMYGLKFRNLRVIRNKSSKVLNLTTMTKSEMMSYLTTLYGKEGAEAQLALGIEQLTARHKTRRHPGVLFVAAIQNKKVEVTPEHRKTQADAHRDRLRREFGEERYQRQFASAEASWYAKPIAPGEMDVVTISGQEQTALIRKLGFDAIVDEAKTPASYSLSEYECNQIVFLSRGAYDVVEVFNLHTRDMSTHTDLFNDQSLILNVRNLKQIIGMCMHAANMKFKITESYYTPRDGARVNVEEETGRFAFWFWYASQTPNKDNPYEFEGRDAINVHIWDHTPPRDLTGKTFKLADGSYKEIAASFAKRIVPYLQQQRKVRPDQSNAQ